MTQTGGRIFHLMARPVWEAQCEGGGAIAADQLERHGFVHCCTREQIVEVATWWLADQAPLVAVEIDGHAAGDLRFELADLGREYPHVYNAIPRDAVVAAHDLADGLPEAIATPAPSFEVHGQFEGRAARVRWQGGSFAGDEEVIAAATVLIEKGEEVTQFPGVTRVASADTAYDAFCVLVAVLDRVDRYVGDGQT